MKKNILLGMLLGSFAMTSSAQYEVSLIPTNLLTSADVIIREKVETYTIESATKARQTEHVVATIMNEKAADDWATQGFHYDNFTKILNLEARLYDANGKELRKLKKGDIQDNKAFNGVAFVDENRYKSFTMAHAQYPYTIAYDVEYQTNNLMFCPSWVPQNTYRMSVQHSEFTVKSVESVGLRYKCIGIEEPKMRESEKLKEYKWEVNDLAALEYETMTKEADTTFKKVILSLGSFKMDEYAGSLESWESFSTFVNAMFADRSQLSPEAKAKAHELTKDCRNIQCKVEKLYTYLQENSRYLMIGLGIGGWQPISAEDVFTKKYGDCKALSNFMRVMLAEVNVPSNCALIYGGDNPDSRHFRDDFPAPFYFNHIVLSIVR